MCVVAGFVLVTVGIATVPIGGGVPFDRVRERRSADTGDVVR